MSSLPLNAIIHGNVFDIFPQIPDKTFDLIFADPPYNLQLTQNLWRPNMTLVKAVNDQWDHFADFNEYDAFTFKWLSQCKRILKDSGSLWVIGTYHNIFRIGKILQDLNFWILNDVIWIKSNPTPNFHGTRFTNAHETLIWGVKSRNSKYTFNYQAMKTLNEDLQMRSDWMIPICTGPERLKANGKKAHSTQKPESLLYRILLATTNEGDLIFDPFFGTGTTGAVAKKLNRSWLGVEQDENYIQLAHERIEAIDSPNLDKSLLNIRGFRKTSPRIPFGYLIESGLLRAGQKLFFMGNPDKDAVIRVDGKLIHGDVTGSIHTLGRHLLNGKPCNGWTVWFYEDKERDLLPIDTLRFNLRKDFGSITELD